MNIAEKKAKQDVASQIKNRLICPVRKRQIVKLHEKACTEEQKNQGESHPSQAECQCEIECPAVYRSWPEMKNKAFKYITGFIPVFVRI